MFKQGITADYNRLPMPNDKQGRLKCNKNVNTIIDDYDIILHKCELHPY